MDNCILVLLNAIALNVNTLLKNRKLFHTSNTTYIIRKLLIADFRNAKAKANPPGIIR